MRADPRKPLGKDWAYTAYVRATNALEPHHEGKVFGIREHVRHLRATCAEMRVRAQRAEREAERLNRELDRLRGAGHE